MEPNARKLSDYLSILDRYKYVIVLTWLLISLIAVIVAFNMPKTFRSTATMLMQAPMPTKISDSPIHLYADEQIQTVYQKVLTTAKVISIIDSHKLFKSPDDSAKDYDPADPDLVKAFKSSTTVELATSSFAETNAKMADIVFNISFDYDEPYTAKEVVNDLAGLLIEMNDKARTQRAARITEFLLEELGKLNQKTQELNDKIATYKEKNIQSLPEQVQANMASVERMESELRDTDSQIRNTKDKIVYLEAELARAKSDFDSAPGEDNKPQSKDEALWSLQSKYAQLSSIYLPSHPDLLRLKREIRALNANADLSPSKDYLLKQLAESYEILEYLQDSYKDTHPEIIKKKLTIEKLEKQLLNAKASSEIERESEGRTFNPAYSAVEVQYKTSKSDLLALTQKQDYLKLKLENTRSLLTMSPKVEVEYTDMVRERDSTVKKYNQLKEKWLDAKLVQAMEEEQQGQTLTILEPPSLPIHPEKAIRKKLAIGGSVVGLLLGLGLAFAFELLNPGIRGYRSVVETTGLTPLIVVPYIESFSEQVDKLDQKKKKLSIKFWIILFNIFMAALLLFGIAQFIGATTG